MAKQIQAWDKRAGQFYRELGKKANGKSHRFYLGEDEKQATASINRLEGLWRGVQERWENLRRERLTNEPFPSWDDTSLSLGNAIRQGKWEVVVKPPNDGPQEIAA
jgi:hypothetical protein